ncbi:MAG: hypothetical protein PHP44_08280 [Kiritimatiellae bacterium]|nr:hypothetical protein [Kiritimatiellia bacterium]
MKKLSWSYGGLLGVSLAVALLLSLGSVLFGNLNQDEGWYLYAAGMMARGFEPYRDFAFTQGPMLPRVYALFYDVVRAQGVLGARVLTALLGLTACGLASGLAARLALPGWKRFAGLAVFLLLGLNAYHAYFSALVKTYSLCSVLLVGGLLLIAWTDGARRLRDSVLCAAGGLLLALAAGTRLSAGVALAAAGIYLLVRDRSSAARWVSFGVGGLAGLAWVFGRGLLQAPEALRFGLLDYHSLREAPGLAQSLILKAGFLSRLVQGYYPAAVLTAFLVIVWLVSRKRQGPALGKRVGAGLLWSAGLAMTAVHLAAPFPYDDYQVMVMPVLTGAVVCSLTGRLAEWSFWNPARRVWLLLALGFACVLSAGSSPVLQDWMVIGRDRIWWRMKDRPDVLKLRDAGRELKADLGGDRLLLTQDTYLAVEADARVPHGMEMGPFCYYPEFTSAEAAAAGGVLNREALLTILRSAEAKVAAFSGYGLSIRSPDVTELTPAEQTELRGALEAFYEPVRTVPDFGQGHTPLTIYQRSAPGAPLEKKQP